MSNDTRVHLRHIATLLQPSRSGERSNGQSEPASRPPVQAELANLVQRQAAHVAALEAQLASERRKLDALRSQARQPARASSASSGSEGGHRAARAHLEAFFQRAYAPSNAAAGAEDDASRAAHELVQESMQCAQLQDQFVERRLADNLAFARKRLVNARNLKDASMCERAEAMLADVRKQSNAVHEAAVRLQQMVGTLDAMSRHDPSYSALRSLGRQVRRFAQNLK